MTLKAHLQFGDNVTGIYSKSYRLVDSHHGVERNFSIFTPQGGVHPQEMRVTLVASDCEDFYLHNWYISNEKRSGRLCFEVHEPKTGIKIIRGIPFEDAQCTSFNESYDTSRKQRRHIVITFTPVKVKMESTSFFRKDKAKDTGTLVIEDDGDVDMEKYNSQYDY